MTKRPPIEIAWRKALENDYLAGRRQNHVKSAKAASDMPAIIPEFVQHRPECIR
jgi:hypothetical protein